MRLSTWDVSHSYSRHHCARGYCCRHDGDHNVWEEEGLRDLRGLNKVRVRSPHRKDHSERVRHLLPHHLCLHHSVLHLLLAVVAGDVVVPEGTEHHVTAEDYDCCTRSGPDHYCCDGDRAPELNG